MRHSWVFRILKAPTKGSVVYGYFIINVFLYHPQNLSCIFLFQEIVSEVLEEKLDKEVPQEEGGTAPKYITSLQQVYPSRDGELIR